MAAISLRAAAGEGWAVTTSTPSTRSTTSELTRCNESSDGRYKCTPSPNVSTVNGSSACAARAVPERAQTTSHAARRRHPDEKRTRSRIVTLREEFD